MWLLLEKSGSLHGGEEEQQDSNALMKGLKQQEEDIGFVWNMVWF